MSGPLGGQQAAQEAPAHWPQAVSQGSLHAPPQAMPQSSQTGWQAEAHAVGPHAVAPHAPPQPDESHTVPGPNGADTHELHAQPLAAAATHDIRHRSNVRFMIPTSLLARPYK